MRTEALIGTENLNKLQKASVIVFGIGGVGGHAAEALVRAGVGSITLVDNDRVSISNLNRQLIALSSNVGRMKTSVMAERLRDIMPSTLINEIPLFFFQDTLDRFNIASYDFVLDCIDSVPSKILLIKEAVHHGVPIISSMGTGNKLHPELLTLADISETEYCPLARAVRTRLKKEGITSLKVVYSKELPKKSQGAPSSISFVPSAAGILMASYAVNRIIGETVK